MLFVHLFLYARKWDPSIDVGMEPDSSGFKN